MNSWRQEAALAHLDVCVQSELTARQSNPFHQKWQVFLFIFDIVLAAPGDKNTRLHDLHSELCSEWLPFHELIGGYVSSQSRSSRAAREPSSCTFLLT
jgi:hypothetical protein